MSDRELLEWAAKAAGIEVYESTDGTLQNRPILVFAAGGGMGTMPYEERWNPLVDDAQALRLAVKLALTIAPFGEAVYVDPPRSVIKRLGLGIISVAFTDSSILNPADEAGARYLEYLLENYPEKTIDVAAATRRAIVRSAAEIGRTM